MSSIILSTGVVTTDSGQQRVDISAFVSTNDWLGKYDKLQFFRSTLGAAGPFEEITGESWSRPRLPVAGGNEPSSPITGALFEMVGESLFLTVQDEEVTITFTGSDPLSLSQIAAQVESQSNGRLNSYVDATGQLVIEAVQPGLASKLGIEASDAQATLGLPVETVTGKDARLNLTSDQTVYQLSDYFGNASNYYRVKLSSSINGGRSEPSVAASASIGTPLSPSNIVLGFCNLVTSAGKAFYRAEVHLFAEGGGPLVDGRLMTGAPTIKYTDAGGYVEFPVVRGQRVTVSVQGTAHIRTITVPTDPAVTKFNFYDPGIADDDIFTVSVPDIITAERRTL